MKRNNSYGDEAHAPAAVEAAPAAPAAPAPEQAAPAQPAPETQPAAAQPSGY